MFGFDRSEYTDRECGGKASARTFCFKSLFALPHFVLLKEWQQNVLDSVSEDAVCGSGGSVVEQSNHFQRIDLC